MESEITSRKGVFGKIKGTNLWQVGLEGIVENWATKDMKDEKLANTIKWTIRIGTSVALAGCTALGTKSPNFNSENTATGTPNSQETNPGQEIPTIKGDLSQISSEALTECINQNPNTLGGIEKESLLGFSVDFAGNKVEFVYSPKGDKFSENMAPVTSENETVILSDALYMKRDTGNWTRLVKVIRQEQGRSLTDWYYPLQQVNPATGENEIVLLQSVLTYPNLTPEKWGTELSLPAEQRPFIGFSPIDQPKNPYDNWETELIRIDIPDGNSQPEGIKSLIGGKPLLSPAIAFTPEPATMTPDYTFTPTSTSTPEPTAIPEEIDLHPNYEEVVSVDFMGVHINSSLITDKSLDPVITKVTVGETAYAEFIARSINKVWLKKGGVNGTGPENKNTTFEEFMSLWATAQKSGLTEDWEKVQVKNIWANEISTPGYEQAPYTIWFMHEGETPEGVRGISKISIALVNGKKVQNISMFRDNEYGEGWGTNIDTANLYVYSTYVGGSSAEKKVIRIIHTGWWLSYNSGNQPFGYITPAEKNFYNLLLNGGLTFQ